MRAQGLPFAVGIQAGQASEAQGPFSAAGSTATLVARVSRSALVDIRPASSAVNLVRRSELDLQVSALSYGAWVTFGNQVDTKLVSNFCTRGLADEDAALPVISDLLTVLVQAKELLTACNDAGINL